MRSLTGAVVLASLVACSLGQGGECAEDVTLNIRNLELEWAVEPALGTQEHLTRLKFKLMAGAEEFSCEMPEDCPNSLHIDLFTCTSSKYHFRVKKESGQSGGGKGRKMNLDVELYSETGQHVALDSTIAVPVMCDHQLVKYNTYLCKQKWSDK